MKRWGKRHQNNEEIIYSMGSGAYYTTSKSPLHCSSIELYSSIWCISVHYLNSISKIIPWLKEIRLFISFLVNRFGEIKYELLSKTELVIELGLEFQILYSFKCTTLSYQKCVNSQKIQSLVYFNLLTLLKNNECRWSGYFWTPVSHQINRC